MFTGMRTFHVSKEGLGTQIRAGLERGAGVDTDEYVIM